MTGFRRGDYGLFPGDLARKRVGDLLMRKAGMWPGDRAIDVECGKGIAAVALARAFTRCRFVATDVDADSLAAAKRNAQIEGCAQRLDFVRALPDALPFKEEAFQVATSAFRFAREKDPLDAFAEIHRVTSYYGKLLVVDVNPDRSRVKVKGVRTNLFEKDLWEEMQEMGWGKIASQKADLLMDGTLLEVLMAKRFDPDEGEGDEDEAEDDKEDEGEEDDEAEDEEE